MEAEDSKVQRLSAGSGGRPLGAPSITLPKGGGAIRGIGEKFGANPVTGTGSMSVPIVTSPGRSAFGPQLSLSYDSGSGNGPFGFGWTLAVPAIARKTERGLPQYCDGRESDVYILSGTEDLVPVLRPDGTRFKDDTTAPGYIIHRYRPRIEGLFARIERWTRITTGDMHWRSITRDNITTFYGKDNNSRIFDPGDPSTAHPRRVFSWLICESYDDKGNAIVYEHAAENAGNVDRNQANERNRLRTANRYLKRIRYGNRVSRLTQPDLTLASWMFEVIFDYDEAHYEDIALNAALPEAGQHRFALASAAGRPWAVRPDPFSAYRAGFEVRTYRRCRRVLMFHHIPDLATGEKGYDGLVRSTEFNYADLDYGKPVTIEGELAHQGSSRFASFLRAVTQSGYVRDDTRATVVRNGIPYATYLRKSLPPLEFEYSKAAINDRVLELDADSRENLPAGLDGSRYSWMDLHGEGIPGILTEQGEGWFYKRNLSPISKHAVEFAPLERVAVKPNLSLAGGAQFMDLAGDGQPDLVTLDSPVPGLYEHDDGEGWEPFRPFTSHLNRDSRDPNLKFIDLDGDGHADVLISEDDAFVWHASLAEAGFAPARRVAKALDEEKGPRLILADATQSIYLADMCGDGLTGLLRIRNGEVCYWPNEGYGRFGAKVTMDNAPWFDNPDQFDQRLVRLADIDGSGTTDIIYLHREGVRLYFNQSGNRLSEARHLSQFPLVDGVASVMTADLMGNGTACLVWSSPLPADAHQPLRYVSLMGETKPHLLVKVINNLGAETELQYAHSTRFYLADKRHGMPWITRLPFPVHVVERVITRDHVSGNRFVTRYAYHHGYFDGAEREFRGFGMVEQWDTEEFAVLTATGAAPTATNVEASSHVPPVHTKTWFHTGVYLGRGRVSGYFSGLLNASDVGEYYREPGLSDAQAKALLLDDSVLPDALTVDEERDACRALKGSMLRQELYARDDTVKQAHPYIVTEQNFTIQTLQRRGGNRCAVFFTHPRESISYHYEREPADPRIGHALTLKVDPFGNVLQSATIAYGRRQPDLSLLPAEQAEQGKLLITLTENRVTSSVGSADDHRTPVLCESRTYELTGLIVPTGNKRFAFDDVLTAGMTATALAYEQDPTVGLRQKRLIEHVRTYFKRDDLAGQLSFGDLQSLGLPFESYKLALTPGLIAKTFGSRASDAMIQNEGRYVHSQADANWWIPSGQMFYSPDSAHTPSQERLHARQHFFLPVRYRDPFHTNTASTESFITYDTYDLLVLETRDALGNRVTVGERNVNTALALVHRGHDYRVLQPAEAMDPNRNRSRVTFDALGVVVGTAVMGKPEEVPVPGDRLTPAFRANLTQAEIDQLLADPRGPIAATLLGDASSRVVYDVTAHWREPDPKKKPPVVAATLARETHASEPVPASGVRFRASLSYSDGFGREIQSKIQAEPGRVPKRGAAGKIIVGTDGQPEVTPNDVSPRWVGNGWTIFNNKGKPVRQYEPFFTDTHRFEFDVRIGVSPVLFYDPVERVVAMLQPDHSWQKVVFDAWRQESSDANDTMAVADPRTDADVGIYFTRLASIDRFLPTWYALRTNPAHVVAATQRWPDAKTRDAERRAADQTLVHAATPTVVHADAVGRPFLTIAHNRFKYSDTPAAAAPVQEFHRTHVVFDIEGNQRTVIDANGRIVMRYDYDMLGNRIHHVSMEAGERWLLNDVAGGSIYAWNSRDHRFRSAYDPLRRPTDVFVREGTAPELLVGRTVYGEAKSNPEATNRRGRVVELFDQAGVVTTDSYDFKGNVVRGHRQLAHEYSTTLDWSAVVPLDAPVYSGRTLYDALNRPIQVIAPHSDQPGFRVNIIQPVYSDANLLEQVHVWLDEGAEPPGTLGAATADLHAVTNIDYDAKGQRTLIDFGNGVRSTHVYDRWTFRLRNLHTARPTGELQNLHYSYDPSGNITCIRDDAQPPVFFNTQRVDATTGYAYDALYRLIEATGREHLGQLGAAPTPTSYNDAPRVGVAFSASDGQAMARYLERYVYDAVGNFETLKHVGTNPAHPGWTRKYVYGESSQAEVGKKNNRLSSTFFTNALQPETYSTLGDGYDEHGNMLRMPQLQEMRWDFKDQLRMTRRQKVNATDVDGAAHHGERTWYVYDTEGQRVRKVTELTAGVVKEERIYFVGFEVFRRNGANALVRETLHVMDDKQRIASVETRTPGSATGIAAQLIRFKFSNHLGSASLELDDQAGLISYEEYTPYGSTSYQSVRSKTEAPRRYRYTGQERDEESGLYYHGARYYAPWLGRWTSCDPMGISDGTDLYAYVRNNPVATTDSTGTTCDSTNATCLQPATEELNFSAGEMRRVPLRLHVDEADAVRGNLAGGVAGSPSDPANKQLLDSRTNVQSKSNFVSSAPANSRPNVSIANSPQEAANRILTSRLSEVDEVRDLANDATANTRPGLRTNSALRARMSADPAVSGALRSSGINPNTLTAENPPGVSQFSTAPSVNLSAVDADVDPRTGQVVPGPNTTAAETRRASTAAPVAKPVSAAGTGTGTPAARVGNGVNNVTRAAVPLVVETEIALGTTAVYAHAAGWTATGVALETGAAAVPVVGAAVVAGATGGHVAETLAVRAGASPRDAPTYGVLGAMAVGAGVGALAGLPAGGIGAGPGAIVGAAVGGAAYLISRYW
jgi:RHS repeat-associated protein